METIASRPSTSSAVTLTSVGPRRTRRMAKYNAQMTQDFDQRIVVHGGVGSQMRRPQRGQGQRGQGQAWTGGEQLTRDGIDAPQAESHEEHAEQAQASHGLGEREICPQCAQKATGQGVVERLLEEGQPVLRAKNLIEGLRQAFWGPTHQSISVPPEALRLHIFDDLLLPFLYPVGIVHHGLAEPRHMQGHLEMTRLVGLHPGSHRDRIQRPQHQRDSNQQDSTIGPLLRAHPPRTDRTSVVFPWR